MSNSSRSLRRNGTCLPALLLLAASSGVAPACSSSEPSTGPQPLIVATVGPPASTATSGPPASASASASPPAAQASAAPSATPSLDAGAATTADAGAPGHPDAGARADTGTRIPRDAGAPSPADAGALAAPIALDAGAATAPSAAQIAAQIDHIFASKRTFQAKFAQSYRMKVNGQTKTSSGVLVIERPSKISFRYDPPEANRIVSDGTTLRMYIAADATVYESPVGQSSYLGALGFTTGGGISPLFSFTTTDKPTFARGPVLLGKPLQASPSYETVFFFVDSALLATSDPGAMAGILILDAQGNRNRFDFSGVTQPASISASEFGFTPPAGTHVVRP